MIDLNKIIINFDFFHCIERDGFVFTSIDEPANILDAIVIRCPENSVSPVCDCLAASCTGEI